ncbi:MAG: NAD(P)-binding domain-containing protein [Acidobacteria bacterium]|nr:NAD(P)-binding domain-containing protein [Acidobacteriota bacterium]
MRIGILGSGEVGRTLGRAFIACGHEVKLGSREAGNPKVKEWVGKTGAHASGGTFEEVAKFGEIIVLATLWAGTENALRLAGAANLAGKVVIDATNPLDFTTTPPRLAVGCTDSAGEQVQRWLTTARVVKAFNMIGSAHMFRPEFPGGPPDMFICGNDQSAKQAVSRILNEFGWEVIDLGRIEASRHLECLAMLWITYGFRHKSWNHAFRLLRK